MSTHDTFGLQPSCRFNKYSQIAARALRNSLKEDPRLEAEKRGISELRYQKWDAGKAGEQVRMAIGCQLYQDESSYRFQYLSLLDLGESSSRVGKEAGKECCSIVLDADPIIIAGVTRPKYALVGGSHCWLCE
jgi:F-type H+-transporting ATPase subunit epsilon